MSVGQAIQRRIGLRNIGHRTLPRIWGGTFFVRAYSTGNDFELIPAVKIETRHPVEGYFGSELTGKM